MKYLIQSILILTTVLMSTEGAEEVVYARVGETVTLKPPEDKHKNSQKYLHWLFGKEDGQELAWRNPMGGKWINWEECKKPGNAKCTEKWKNTSLSGDSLVIENIQQEHFGTFFCKMIFDNEEIVAITKVLKLSVTVNPLSPLLPGESVTLTCNAESPQSHKKPEIHWLNPQGERNNQGSLTVRATGQHNGQWTCVVTNDGKESKAKISVTVLDLSRAGLCTQYTSTSSLLVIPCSLSSHISWEHIKAKGLQRVHWDFFPKSSSALISGDAQRLFSLSLEDPLKWKADQDRGLTPVPDLKKGNLSLTRSRGREEDRGHYVCTLEFKNGVTLNRTVDVHVLQIISTQGPDLISGQQVNLTCSLGHPLPSGMRLKWIPPDQSSMLSLTSDHHPAHFTIPEVSTGDGGTWRCELLQSNTRLTLALITLKIEPNLSVWMLVIICSVTVILILILILLFILFRRRQRRVRHLRHRLCQCKNPKPRGFYRT